MDPGLAIERALPAFSAVRPGDWSGLRAAVVKAGVPGPLAAEVLAFVPIAFGRALLDGMGIEFAPEYATADAAGGTRTAGLLADHPVYAAAAARAAGMMERQEGGDAFVAVAVWSSEFSAVNQALNAGSNPADLAGAPPLVMLDGGDDVGATPAPSPAAKPAPAPAPPQAAKPWWRIWG